MKPGKLPHEALAEMLRRLPAGDPRVVVGPRVGEDAAALDFGERLLVAAMDPITFATDLIGWYAVHVNANDIAAMGAEPRWFLAALLVPEAAREDDVEAVFDQIARSCEELGVSLIGGHTEVTLGIERPIVVGCMLGEVERGRLLTSAGAREGDAVILAGAIAAEGTAILAREAGGALGARGLSEEKLARARGMLTDPGISVVAAARAASGVEGVTALHDPTEGGLATGLRELGMASGVGLEIEADRIPVMGLTREVCEALGLDPMGLIASGSLLVAARAEAAADVLARLEAAGVVGVAIGRATASEEGFRLVSAGRRGPLPEFARDEVARFFEKAQGENG